MSELKDVVVKASALAAERRPYLLVTTISVEGASRRRPGSRTLIGAQGESIGPMGAGCLERDLARRGWWLTERSDAVLVTYDTTWDEEEASDRGRGPYGVIEVLVERVQPRGEPSALSFIQWCLNEEKEGVLLTVFRSEAAHVPVGAWLGVGARSERAGSALVEPALVAEARRAPSARCARVARVMVGDAVVEALVEVIRPAVHLFVMGGGVDAVPLVMLARSLGWTVTVWDPQQRVESRVRFAAADRRHSGPAAMLRHMVDRAACPVAVVMTHDLERDQEALRMLLPSLACYIGVLGPRGRTEQLLDRTGPVAWSEGQRARFHAPAGLTTGAETPTEVAISIVAEIQAELHGETIGHLRDRGGPILEGMPTGTA
jgi:xanthine/CO dehydrogenase XdhC/CoxF family maturation factor